MIELSNELIAASSCATDFPIIIVDLCSYAIVEVIKERKYITHFSSLCVLGPHSFVYVYKGKMV